MTRNTAAPSAGATLEQIVVASAAFWTLSASAPFLSAAIADRSFAEPATWGWCVALFALLTSLHVVTLGLVATRRTVRPLIAALTLLAAVGAHHAAAYRTVLDPSMVRNVLRTDPAEARELVTASLALHVAAFAGLPILVLWRTPIAVREWRAALRARLALLGVAAVIGVGTLLVVFQPLASLMRNRPELRYLISPANLVWSSARVLTEDARARTAAREPIGTDAAPGASWAGEPRPRVLVFVLGETARSANWGLSGYRRQTTPRLAARDDLIDFPRTRACGTSTEASLPCLFGPTGAGFDPARVRRAESVLHVLARAGVAVHWRDNQSGCKGVCDGLPTDTVAASAPAGTCSDGRCPDEALLHDLERRLDEARGTQLWVLHTIGNHGPSYFRRYPPAFAHFLPDCRSDDLRRCSREEIVNAYDNALRYTDHVLATVIERLTARAGRIDAALLYVSDHGESLGEGGLYLHGVPLAIAPDVQTQVPMVAWVGDGFARRIGLDRDCLARRAAEPAAHRNVVHTLLGLLDVRTALHDPALDLTGRCRAATAQSASPPAVRSGGERRFRAAGDVG